MVDLTVRYTATTTVTPKPTIKGLAVRNSKATAAEDLDSTYGRIQITLPVGWGPGGTIAQDGMLILLTVL